jgi:formylglycine-generating enzyme required for sulfatase activity
MHGNVQEWCQDWYGPYQPGAGPLADPEGPLDGKKKVFRGGSYFWPAAWCRSAHRDCGPVTGIRANDYRHDSIGLRVARTRGRGERPPNTPGTTNIPDRE